MPPPPDQNDRDRFQEGQSDSHREEQISPPGWPRLDEPPGEGEHGLLRLIWRLFLADLAGFAGALVGLVLGGFFGGVADLALGGGGSWGTYLGAILGSVAGGLFFAVVVWGDPY